MDYGSFLFHNSAKCHISKLDKIQNQALRIIGGFVKSTPIQVMEAEICIPPLFLRRLYLCYKYILKSRSGLNDVTIELLKQLRAFCLTRYWQNKRKPLLVDVYNKTKHIEIYSSPILDIFTAESWLSRLDIKDIAQYELKCVRESKHCYIVEELKSNVNEELQTKYFDWHMIFTDGSKSEGLQGAAFFDPSLKNYGSYKVENNVCIMTLELFAVSKALSYAEAYGWDKIVICSDSRSAIQHLARCASGHRGVPTAFVVLGQLLQLQSRNVRVRLQWVPSHIGIWGNEEADKLAKTAHSNIRMYYISPCYSEALTNVKAICQLQWNEYFNEQSNAKGIWYRTMQSEPPRIPWFMNANLSNKKIKLIVKLRSGHFPCRKFAYLMKKVNSPNCEICGNIEDIVHLLLECDRNRTEREQFLRDFQINMLNVGALQSILSDPISDAAIHLCSLIE